MYINDFSKRATSICKTFADCTSLFSKVDNKYFSTVQMNEDLETISNWAHQWKILFNSNPNKHSIGVCFSQKHKKVNYSSLFLMVIKFNQFQAKNKRFRRLFQERHCLLFINPLTTLLIKPLKIN